VRRQEYGLPLLRRVTASKVLFTKRTPLTLGAAFCLFGCANTATRTTAFPLQQGEFQFGATADVGVRMVLNRPATKQKLLDPKIISGDREEVHLMPNVGGLGRVGLGLQSDLGLTATAGYFAADVKMTPLLRERFALAVNPAVSPSWVNGILSFHAPLLFSWVVSRGLVLSTSAGLVHAIPLRKNVAERSFNGTLVSGSVGAKFWTGSSVGCLLELGFWLPVAGQAWRDAAIIVAPTLTFVFGAQPERADSAR
jgi:hypothetical protein